MKHGLQEVKRHLKRAEEARNDLTEAKVGRDLRESWEAFLQEFSRGLGKLITLSKQNIETRPFGHRLYNASQRDDEGLIFLREARNQDEHGLEPSAQYEEGVTNIFNAFGLGPTCKNVKFENNVVNGINTGIFEVDTDAQGRISRLETKDPIVASYTPAHIKLAPIESDDKGKTFCVPKQLNGEKLETASPALLSQMALKFLSLSIDDYEQLSR
jgi:hypothetical protein